LTASCDRQPGRNFETVYRLLLPDPAACEDVCRATLAQADSPVIRMLLASALRLQGKLADSEAVSSALAQSMPRWAGAHFEHGMTLGRQGRHVDAL